MLSPKTAALGLVALLCVGNLWTSLVRSGIPLNIDGRVVSVEVRREKHPGVDDVLLVHIEDRILHLDKALVELLQVGDSLRKESWSAIVEINGRSVKVSPSRDFYGMVFAMALLLGTASVVLLWRSE